MLIDGKQIAADIYTDIRRQLAGLRGAPCLTVFTCAPNAETRKFLELKQRRAAENGIDVVVIEFDAGVAIDKVEESIRSTAGKCEGVVVQLPFPAHLDRERLLAAIPPELDVDATRYQGEETPILPPVVGAIAAIVKKHGIDLTGRKIVIVGRGRLVGQPAALWVASQAAVATVIDKNTDGTDRTLREADIIISGAGVPGLIKPDDIKEGAIILDAGTSEEGGQLRGDADPECALKCALFTPVPGGIGPVTIAVLLRNVALLAARNGSTMTTGTEGVI